MKLIGVTGKSGSGKTTFSDMLAENPNIDVIHIDDILYDIKLKYFKLIMKENKDGEKIKVDSKLKTFIYKNKIIFNLFMKFRAKLIEKPLEKEIQRLKSQGIENIVIEDTFIKYHKRYKDMAKVFFIQRPYIARIEALQAREKLPKEEVVAADVAHHKGHYNEEATNKVLYKINNNSTPEELKQKAQEIYIENFALFKDKHKEYLGKNVPIIKESNKNIDKKISESKDERI